MHFLTTDLLSELTAGRVSDEALASLPLIEEYRLVRGLGHGAMGCVYLAHDTLLDRQVALKFLLSLHHDEAARLRFFIEARAIARLSHPNVVGIYRIGEVLGQPFLVSEFVSGRSLDRLPLPLPAAQVRELGLMLSHGLSAAHRRGVLHRDIKPHNAILSNDGTVKLLDFGLAKLRDRDKPSLPAVPVSEDPVVPATRLSETAPPDDDEPVRSPRVADSAVPGDGIDTERLALQKTVRSAERSPKPRSDVQGGALTMDGAVLGTPLYMAPEVWQGESATERSDLYSLGAVLFELATGRPPQVADNLAELELKVLADEPEKVHAIAPQLDVRLGEVIDRCLARSPAARFASVDELSHALERLGEPSKVRRSDNPFLGLRSFGIGDSGVFFGRSTEVSELVARLKTDPMILLAGDSGVGKSSLCRAGVAANVLAHGLADDRTYRLVEFSPGHTPAKALCDALSPILGQSAGEILSLLRSDPGTLARWVQRQPADGDGILLFVDQLEELCTQSDPVEADLLSEWLGLLTVRAPGLRVILCARGDFLTRLSALPGLGRDFSSRLYIVRPLSADGLRQAITEPAAQLGVHFESPELVDELLRSTLHADGGLPLLQFALAELWEAREKASGLITAEALSSIGGVAGALARHADQVIRSLLPTERMAAKRILLRLLTTDGLRATRPLSEIRTSDPAEPIAIEALVRGRLLLAREVGGETAFELAHEALIKGWAEFRRWIDGEGERRLVVERLSQAATEWQRLGHVQELLWDERRLLEVELLSVEPRILTDLAQRFLAESQRHSRKRQRDRRGIIAVLLLLPLLVVLLSWQFHTATEQRRLRVAAEQSELGMRAISLSQLPGSELLALQTALQATQGSGETLPVSQAQEGLFMALRAALRSLPLVSPAAQAIAISPSGDSIVVATESGPVLLFPRGKRRFSHMLSTQSRSRQLQWLGPSLLAAGYDDGTVRFFDTSSGKLVRSIPAHRDRIVELSVVDGGQLVVTASFDGSAALWDVQQGKLRHRFDADGQPLRAVRIVRDHALLSTASGELFVLKSSDGSIEKTLRCDDGTKAANGGQLAHWQHRGGDQIGIVSGGKMQVCVVDLATLHIGTTLRLDGQPIFYVQGSASGLAILGQKGTSRIFDPGDLSQRSEQQQPFEPRSVAFLPAADRLLVGGSDGSITALHIATGRQQVVADGPGEPITALAGGDGLTVTGSSDGSVRAWQPDSDGASLSKRRTSEPVEKIVPVPGRDDFLVLGQSGKLSKLALEQTDLLTLRKDAVLSVSPDGQTLLIGHADGNLELWSLLERRSIRAWKGHHAPVTEVVFSLDGKHLASSSRDLTAALWRTDDQALVERFSDPNPATGVALGLDGRRIATANSLGRVALWERPGTGPILRMRPEDESPFPTHLLRSPGGSHLLIIGQQTAIIPLASTVTEPLRLSGHLGPTLRGNFSASGHEVVTLGKDRTIRVYDAQFATQKLILRPDDPRDVLFAQSDETLLVASGKQQSIVQYPSSLARLRKKACELLAPGSDEAESSDLCSPGGSN